jgi:hypothetical protein
MYRFELGDAARVTARKGDPGGVGTVTGREQREDNRGVVVLYRVLIPGHALQERVSRAKSRENNGFWYVDALCNGAADAPKEVKMRRVRIFKPVAPVEGERGERYRYEKTVIIPRGADLERALEEAGTVFSDIGYWDDTYWRRTLGAPGGWISLDPELDHLRGLYGQAVRAEEAEAREAVVW